MHKYPKVNYIGNKEKLAQWIISEMPVKTGKVLDIFAGGCSVSDRHSLSADRSANPGESRKRIEGVKQ